MVLCLRQLSQPAPSRDGEDSPCPKPQPRTHFLVSASNLLLLTLHRLPFLSLQVSLSPSLSPSPNHRMHSAHAPFALLSVHTQCPRPTLSPAVSFPFSWTFFPSLSGSNTSLSLFISVILPAFSLTSFLSWCPLPPQPGQELSVQLCGNWLNGRELPAVAQHQPPPTAGGSDLGGLDCWIRWHSHLWCPAPSDPESG